MLAEIYGAMSQLPSVPTSPLARQAALLSPQQLGTPTSQARNKPLSPPVASNKLQAGVPSQKHSLATLRILLVRHGLSEDNQAGIWAGHRDSPLASTGVNQAKALGNALANCSLVAIYSSDLKRASRTAEEILAVNRTVPPPTLVQTQSLREQNFGQWEGKSYSEAEQLYANSVQGSNGRSFRAPDAETLDEVNARMAVSLRRYILPRLESLRAGRDLGSEPQVAVVAHGVAIAEIIRVLLNLHDDSEGSPWSDPKETYRRVRLENTGWTLVELAVPILGAERLKGDPLSKKTYVRIVQQNVTDHLQGSLQSAQSSAASALLAGGTSQLDDIDNSRLRAPSYAHQNLRKVRSYDARHLTRELERAGASAAMLPGSSGREAALHALGSQSQSSMLPSVNGPGSWSDVWQSVCVRILPLFSDSETACSVEDVNVNVSEHIKRSLERSPARALDSLSRDVYALSTTGMLTLNARLDAEASSDLRMLESLIDNWKRFYSRTLPWLEGSLLPLQTNATLLSLSKSEDDPTSSLRTERIDIRRIALTAFRDKVLLSRVDQLYSIFQRLSALEASRESAHQQLRRKRQFFVDDAEDAEGPLAAPRLYPYLLQLSNVSCSVLTNDEAQASMEDLVRVLRSGSGPGVASDNILGRSYSSSRASPSTLRSKRSQARHGWLPRSAAKHGRRAAPSYEDDEEEDGAGSLVDAMRRARVRNDAAAAMNESAVLSSLRSPAFDVPADGDDSVDSTPVQASVPHFDGPRNSEEDLAVEPVRSGSSAGRTSAQTTRSAHRDDPVIDFDHSRTDKISA